MPAGAWTKTLYDTDGRAYETLANYDITGNARLEITTFESARPKERSQRIRYDPKTERDAAYARMIFEPRRRLKGFSGPMKYSFIWTELRPLLGTESAIRYVVA